MTREVTPPGWTSGSGAERARVTVRKAIASALEAIHRADPVVARHLTARVRTGLRCCYEPDPDAPVDWKLAASSPSTAAVTPNAK